MRDKIVFIALAVLAFLLGLLAGYEFYNYLPNLLP
jgi:hypothetical protein